MRPEAREELFDQARALSTERRTWSEADRRWRAVVAAYRDAVATERVDRNDERQLARALWRHSMLLAAMDRAEEGIGPGREAVATFSALSTAVAAEEPDVTGPRHDAARAELITAMLDLGEVSFIAGHPAARHELVEYAISVGLYAGPPPTLGPLTRAAMGTAYHNKANALMTAVEQGPTPASSAEHVREAALDASRAVELRQALATPAQPLSLWELANTYGVYAHCLLLLGDLDRAAAVVGLGERLVDVLGPRGTESISARLRAASAALAQARSRDPRPRRAPDDREGTDRPGSRPRSRWWKRGD